MPKKRHNSNFSKPQSTAPASLATSLSTSQKGFGRANGVNDSTEKPGSVNSRLAELRLADLKHQGRANLAQQEALEKLQWAVAPSLPPPLSAMLQRKNELVPVRARRRGVPGPPAPPSWLRRAGRGGPPGGDADSGPGLGIKRLPGLYLAAKGSLVDSVLRRFAADWDSCRRYYRYYLYYELPDDLKAALICYLGMREVEGVSVPDLQAILLPPVLHEEDEEDYAESGRKPWTKPLAQGLTYLDLSGSLGKAFKLDDLSKLLFPAPLTCRPEPAESWEDAAKEPLWLEHRPGERRPLLPNLTHLSLALDPSWTWTANPPMPPPAASWGHLLKLAASLDGLTHLSLAYWPVPTTIPKTVAACVGASLYGGVGPCSRRALKDVFEEAAGLASSLSHKTRGLEYLDLTGCGAWAPAVLMRPDGVDWTDSWAKVDTVVLRPARPPRDVQDEKRCRREVDDAGTLERYVRAQRRGEGRDFTVVVV